MKRLLLVAMLVLFLLPALGANYSTALAGRNLPTGKWCAECPGDDPPPEGQRLTATTEDGDRNNPAGLYIDRGTALFLMLNLWQLL